MTFRAFPDTSRKPKKGERESRTFAFTSRSKMETDIKNGRYLEHGEYEGNLYGIKTDSIQEVIEAGRICILDPNPQVCTAITQLITAHCHMNTHSSILGQWDALLMGSRQGHISTYLMI